MEPEGGGRKTGAFEVETPQYADETVRMPAIALGPASFLLIDARSRAAIFMAATLEIRVNSREGRLRT